MSTALWSGSRADCSLCLPAVPTQVEVLSSTYAPAPPGRFLPCETLRKRMRFDDFSKEAADACRAAEGADGGGTQLLYLQWRGLPSGDEAAAETCARPFIRARAPLVSSVLVKRTLRCSRPGLVPRSPPFPDGLRWFLCDLLSAFTDRLPFLHTTTSGAKRPRLDTQERAPARCRQRNFWAGAAVTSRLHFDALDNVHCVWAGKKTVLLFSPFDACVAHVPRERGAGNNWAAAQSVFQAHAARTRRAATSGRGGGVGGGDKKAPAEEQQAASSSREERGEGSDDTPEDMLFRTKPYRAEGECGARRDPRRRRCPLAATGGGSVQAAAGKGNAIQQVVVCRRRDAVAPAEEELFFCYYLHACVVATHPTDRGPPHPSAQSLQGKLSSSPRAGGTKCSPTRSRCRVMRGSRRRQPRA